MPKIRKIALDDPAVCAPSGAARSPSWLALHGCVSVDGSVVRALKDEALASGRNARLCLHAGPDELLHEMVIVQHWDSFFPPKRHPRPRSFLAVDGPLLVVTFTDDGAVAGADVVDGSGVMAVRVGPGVFHTDLPLAPLTVHYEITTGPYRGDSDREMAPWGPPVEDRAARLAFRERILAELGLPA
jgi:cupin fold WbuC family metalloprotein